MRSSIYRAFIHYYVALKLSAGAVSPMFGPQFQDQPVPLVRRYIQQGDTLWDAREIVTDGRNPAIVTLPYSSSQRVSRAPHVGQN